MALRWYHAVRWWGIHPAGNELALADTVPKDRKLVTQEVEVVSNSEVLD